MTSLLSRTILVRTTWTNSSEGKPDLVVDQDQRHKITLKIEGKADRTAKGYKFICPLFQPDKTSLHQGLENLPDKFVTLSCPISLAFNFNFYRDPDTG